MDGNARLKNSAVELGERSILDWHDQRQRMRRSRTRSQREERKYEGGDPTTKTLIAWHTKRQRRRCLNTNGQRGEKRSQQGDSCATKDHVTTRPEMSTNMNKENNIIQDEEDTCSFFQSYFIPGITGRARCLRSAPLCHELVNVRQQEEENSRLQSRQKQSPGAQVSSSQATLSTAASRSGAMPSSLSEETARESPDRYVTESVASTLSSHGKDNQEATRSPEALPLKQFLDWHSMSASEPWNWEISSMVIQHDQLSAGKQELADTSSSVSVEEWHERETEWHEREAEFRASMASSQEEVRVIKEIISARCFRELEGDRIEPQLVELCISNQKAPHPPDLLSDLSQESGFLVPERSKRTPLPSPSATTNKHHGPSGRPPRAPGTSRTNRDIVGDNNKLLCASPIYPETPGRSSTFDPNGIDDSSKSSYLCDRSQQSIRSHMVELLSPITTQQLVVDPPSPPACHGSQSAPHSRQARNASLSKCRPSLSRRKSSSNRSPQISRGLTRSCSESSLDTYASTDFPCKAILLAQTIVAAPVATVSFKSK